MSIKHKLKNLAPEEVKQIVAEGNLLIEKEDELNAFTQDLIDIILPALEKKDLFTLIGRVEFTSDLRKAVKSTVKNHLNL